MTLETKEALENLNRAFEQFKTTNDDRLAEIERKGQADVVTEEKLARLDQDLERLQNMTRRLHAAGQRPGLEGKATELGPDLQQKAQFFDGFIRKGQEVALDQKALSTAVDTDGGYTVPVALDQQIEKRLRDISPIRAEAHVIAIGTSRYKKLVNTGGMTSGWVSESGARVETDSPIFQEIEPPLGEIYANPAATQTMLDDAFFNVESWLSEELAEEFALQENAAFVSGDGVNKPKGFLTYALSANDDGSRVFGEIQTLATGVAGGWAASNRSGARPEDRLSGRGEILYEHRPAQ